MPHGLIWEEKEEKHLLLPFTELEIFLIINYKMKFLEIKKFPDR
jgi:hypothetical protein